MENLGLEALQPPNVLARVTKLWEAEKTRQRHQSQPLPLTVVQLPLWPEPTRGTPNAWLRGALFAAIQGKERRALKREILATVDGIEIRFTGWQLDQSDMDVWETIVHLSRLQAMGQRVEFAAHSILKALGRGTGKSQHEWLKDAIARLYSAGVEITVGRYTYFGNLLKGARDEVTDRMLINRLYPDEEQDDGVSRLVWLRNWFGVLVLFVGFSFAAYYRYPVLVARCCPTMRVFP